MTEYWGHQVYCQEPVIPKYDGDRLPIRIVPKLGIQHGIDAARLLLPTCWFDGRACYDGIDALRSYRRTFHEHTQQYSDTPLHDWASNGADAFRYLALVADKSVAMPVEKEPRHGPAIAGLPNNEQAKGYCLNDLFKERANGDWKRSIIRL